jgi:thiol:disulfide interchange protein
MLNDPITKVGTVALIGLVLLFGYRWVYPRTHFEADGMDSSWDAAADNRDKTEPSIVIFSAQWCPACQGLETNVLSRSDVRAEINRHYNVHFVDLTSPTIEVNRHANRLGVSSIPTLIFYNVNGSERMRNHGGSAEEMLSWLKAGE